MKGKVILILLCLFFQCLSWNLPSTSSFGVNQNSQVIYVPNNYTTIQAAINAASPGDTVFVQNRTYHEHVVVNKSISLIGEQLETTIIDGSNTGITVLVTSSNVTVSNLTMQNGVYGILVENTNDVTISRNNVFNNEEGIRLDNSENCSVTENNSSFNLNRGIFLNSCWDSIVYKNVAFNNTDGKQYGINANASRNIALLQNTAIGNFWDGIGLQSSTDCIVWRNNVSRNENFGIWCSSSNNSVIYHNIVANNTLNARATNSEILWDSGYPSGGNYWSDYSDGDNYSGPYQNEIGSDGIGDTPHVIESPYHQDNYSLMSPRTNGSVIFLALQNKTIKPRDDVLIYGFLWPKLDEVNITIYYRNQIETEWQTLETISTYAGKYSYLWTNLDEGIYELKASWAGNSTTYPAESLIETLTVQKITSNVSITVSSTEMLVGSTVTISGSIDPIRPHVNVAIWHRFKDEDWTILETVETYDNGSYSFMWLTPKVGMFQIKTSWLGDEKALPAESLSVVIIVSKLSSSLTINLDRTTTTAGSNVTISGTINPPCVNVNVTIHYRLLNSTWNILDTVTTYSNGYYNYTWKTTETGNYEIKTSWLGDSETLPAESNVVPVTIEQEPPLYIVLYAVIVTAIIVIASLMYLRKKRKH
ncbi:MAG: right-handed parallel beta-helix repeat-containing protein [Candidatus Bathyarchaeota archaeon]|nr:right-handed parallel beta-helix repeat-containing protein [Candidatus Bathyarchaeota archaeon]MDH5494661.1 right-handed parallel beta-helix repeat-containing protein [Candidatus Bathyarchaeota archaeon]